MNLWNLKEMVSQGENASVEFKRKANHPDKIVKEVVAFANTRGGYLLIGVDDNGTIPGLKFASEEAFVLEKAINEYCKPRIQYKLDTIHLSGKKAVLCFYILESKRKPHYVIEDFETGQGKAYVRVEDRSIQASREVKQILRRRRSPKDIHFQYGDKERLLMNYLEAHDYITVRQFSELAKVNRSMSSKTLILLVLANVLKIIPREKEDHFILKHTVTE